MLLFTEGIVIGLTLAILIGPIFITLLQTSMQAGIKAGMVVGAGIWISDILAILIAWWSIQRINHWLENPTFLLWQSIVGGFIIIVVGFTSLFWKQNLKNQTNQRNARYYINYFNRGFLVNFINPFTFVFWITMLSNRASQPVVSPRDMILFFSGILGTIIITDTTKVILARKISTYLTPYHIGLIHKIGSLMLIIFGIVIIFQVL